MEKCTCKFCTAYDKYRWATIMECGCGCHNNEMITGHDDLCCEFPNGKKKDNPYPELEKATTYRAIMEGIPVK